jgi:hypothetical protein
MKRVPVKSSSLLEIGYDPTEQKLEVKFQSGRVYQYFGVPRASYEAFMAAESKGRFFNDLIKDLYGHVKVFG